MYVTLKMLLFMYEMKMPASFRKTIKSDHLHWGYSRLPISRVLSQLDHLVGISIKQKKVGCLPFHRQETTTMKSWLPVLSTKIFSKQHEITHSCALDFFSWTSMQSSCLPHSPSSAHWWFSLWLLLLLWRLLLLGFLDRVSYTAEWLWIGIVQGDIGLLSLLFQCPKC